MVDTIYYESEGNGGGTRELGFKKDIMEIGSMKSIMDSININIRKRNYEKVNTDCRTILNNYSDSLQSGGVISKLYLADLRLDSSGNRISELKSYLESLILNNNEIELLIKQAFYYIQKCKVRIGDYASAMTGFQQIIDQNPYSYEGLVASWDFASASLLLNGQGGSGGEKDLGLGISDLEYKNSNLLNSNDVEKNFELYLKNKYLNDDPNLKDNYDTKSFTKEDRKIIRENVFKSYETSREKETAILKTLEKKVSDGIANENEKSELTVKKTLNELIKTSKPKDINEHINKMNSNIEKVFGINYDNSVKAKKGIIPIEFNLSQNYPNPFNPVTNLEFQIPKSGFVSLKVYDLLGKEVAHIVNENLNSGTYRYKFDGSNFASGVYFYKITVGDFSAVKRMVLIK